MNNLSAQSKREEETGNGNVIKTLNGLSAYQILHIKDCPFKLPKARSMTQARLDYESLEDQILKWYETELLAINPIIN
jgi:hypothetical protein